MQTIIGDLEKEREKFDEEVKQKELVPGALPWVGIPDAYIVKKHVLALSLVANFIRCTKFFTGVIMYTTAFF